MNVLIIGSGAVASILSWHLAKQKNVRKITCTYRNRKKAKEFIDISNKKIGLQQVLRQAPLPE